MIFAGVRMCSRALPIPKLTDHENTPSDANIFDIPLT